MHNINRLLMVIISGGLGLATALALSRVLYYARIGRSKRRRLLQQLTYPQAEQDSTAAQVAERVEIADRLLPDFEPELIWAALTGVTVTQQELVGYTVMSTILTSVAGLLLLGLPGSVVGLAGFYLPYLWLKSQADAARNQFHRQLPEMLQVLAAETATGVGLSNALERLAQSQSMVGAVFAKLLTEARVRQGPLWSQPNWREGTLKQLAKEWQSKTLLSLISQLEIVQRRGVSGPETMTKLARGMSMRFLGEARTQADQLENKLVLPLGLFFFAPFTAATIAPIITMLLSIF